MQRSSPAEKGKTHPKKQRHETEQLQPPAIAVSDAASFYMSQKRESEK